MHTKGKQTQAVTDIYFLGLLVVVVGHSWLQCNPPRQVSFTPLGLRKSLGILRKVLEASRADSHLKLKEPQGKHTVKILEFASILPAESKLTNSQLNSQWVGPGGTGNGSNDGSSGLDMGEVCLGDRPPASLRTLGQVSFLLSWPCWRKDRGLGGMEKVFPLLQTEEHIFIY